jgi:hypothetical protein
MVDLNYKEWKQFLKKIEEGLKHPVGPVPTPKLNKAIEKIHRMIDKKLNTINDERKRSAENQTRVCKFIRK